MPRPCSALAITTGIREGNPRSSCKMLTSAPRRQAAFKASETMLIARAFRKIYFWPRQEEGSGVIKLPQSSYYWRPCLHLYTARRPYRVAYDLKFYYSTYVYVRADF